LSFDVQQGELFGFLGPNGAGKTTTMSMICGLLVPDEGSVELNGEQLEPTRLGTRQMLGVVPQDLALYPELTGIENLRFFGQIYGLKGLALDSRIGAVLKQTQLTDSAKRRVDTYSGGMKRRLNFGAAILHEPRLLILDEPTVGVDPQSRSHLLDCIRQLGQEGTTVLFASHYMEEVEVLCERVAIIDHGKLLACGTIRELLSDLNTSIRLTVDGPIDQLELQTLTNANETNIIELQTNQDLDESLTHTLNKIRQANCKVTSIDSREANLEQLFLQLTGHSLRD